MRQIAESPGKRKGTTRIANRNRRCGSGSRAALIMFKCMHRMQHRIENTKPKSISASTPPPNTIYHNSRFIIIEEGSWPSFMPPPLLNAHYVSSRIAFRRTSRVTRADAEYHVRKPTGQSEHFAIGKFCEREAYGRRCLQEYAVSAKLRGVHGTGARSRAEAKSRCRSQEPRAKRRADAEARSRGGSEAAVAVASWNLRL